jgi:hypothetical protein
MGSLYDERMLRWLLHGLGEDSGLHLFQTGNRETTGDRGCLSAVQSAVNMEVVQWTLLRTYRVAI